MCLIKVPDATSAEQDVGWFLRSAKGLVHFREQKEEKFTMIQQHREQVKSLEWYFFKVVFLMATGLYGKSKGISGFDIIDLEALLRNASPAANPTS